MFWPEQLGRSSLALSSLLLRRCTGLSTHQSSEGGAPPPGRGTATASASLASLLLLRLGLCPSSPTPAFSVFNPCHLPPCRQSNMHRSRSSVARHRSRTICQCHRLCPLASFSPWLVPPPVAQPTMHDASPSSPKVVPDPSARLSFRRASRSTPRPCTSTRPCSPFLPPSGESTQHDIAQLSPVDSCPPRAARPSDSINALHRLCGPSNGFNSEP